MPSKNHIPPQDEGQEAPVSVESLERQEEMLWISHEPAPQEAFPPCIKAILSGPLARGKHRTAAILASFLGQVGFHRDEAGRIWHEATDAEERIFEEWFCRMNCPKCRALQRKGSGYPELGVADLELCRPDDLCPNFEGPVEYACRLLSETDRGRGSLTSIRARYRLRIFDWSSGKVVTIELSEKDGGALELLLKEKAAGRDKILVYKRVRVKGRLRPCFSLRDQEEPRRQMLSDLI